MKFSYSYPALLRSPRTVLGKHRVFAVRMDGTTEIPEITQSEFPTALVTRDFQGRVEYRFHEGRFYARTVATNGLDPDQGDVGLDFHMLAAMGEASRPPTGRETRINPGCVGTAVALSWVDRDGYRRIPGHQRRFTSADWQEMPTPSSMGAFDPSEERRWTDIASAYVDALVSLEGEIWSPVPEPVVALGLHRSAIPVRVIDSTVYDGRKAHPRDMPFPYGRRNGFTSVFWHQGYSMASFLEKERIPGFDASFEVHLPEAFDPDHPRKEMDRVARVVVSELNSVLKDAYGGVRKAPSAIQDAYWALLGQTPEASLADGDAVDGILPEVEWLVMGDQNVPPSLDAKFWVPMTMVKLIRTTRETWNNREVTVDFGKPGLYGPAY